MTGLIGLPGETMCQVERLGIRDQIMTLTIAGYRKLYDEVFLQIVE